MSTGILSLINYNFLSFLFFLQFLFHHCSISIHQNYHFLGIRNKKNLVPKWLFWRSMISTFIQSSWIFSHKKIIKESWIKKSSSSQSSPLLHCTTTTTKRKSVGFMSMRAACESLINRNRNWYQWEKNNIYLWYLMIVQDCEWSRTEGWDMRQCKVECLLIGYQIMLCTVLKLAWAI